MKTYTRAAVGVVAQFTPRMLLVMTKNLSLLQQLSVAMPATKMTTNIASDLLLNGPAQSLNYNLNLFSWRSILV